MGWYRPAGNRGTGGNALKIARDSVHRDIKPDNVMIRPDGYVKVLDFGLMKLMPTGDVDLDETHTEPGRVLRGTPATTMSPEQARGLETDPRSDVWSVGASSCTRCAAGRVPFSGPSTADVIAAILHDEVAAAGLRALQVPEPLSRLVLATLSKDAARRHESAAELHAALVELRTESDAAGTLSAQERCRPSHPWSVVTTNSPKMPHVRSVGSRLGTESSCRSQVAPGPGRQR